MHHLLITFANDLDPDQDRQNVGPDPDPNLLTQSLIVLLIFVVEKSQQRPANAKTITQHAKSAEILCNTRQGDRWDTYLMISASVKMQTENLL